MISSHTEYAIKEKNPKWLQDDYVKFIRFAQWKIDQAGIGVLGFITNHSYLDNLTFRGMRRSLMNSFNEIFILDLHGNSKRKEKCPDGSKDENVFDIQQGVSIGLFIKTGNKNTGCKVYHADAWGLREDKYDWLLSHDLKKTTWSILSPRSESYLFVRRDERLLEQYEKSPNLPDIFLVNSVGIVTARDKLTIQYTPHDVWTTVLNFSKIDVEIARQAYQLGKDVRDWKVAFAQKDLIDTGLDKRKIVPILYRPFDIRYTYYTGRSRGFHCMPRREVMRHMIEKNVGIICPKQFKERPGAFIASHIIGHKTVSAYDINYLFPLHLYPKTDKGDLFSEQEQAKGKQLNISEKIFSALSETYKTKPKPEDIFYYIYAIFYSNTYRKKYAEFLKTDFPRVPFTKDKRLFKRLAEYGKGLADLHLMRSPELDSPVVKFQGTGDKRVDKIKVDKIKHDKDGERVYINKDQYFEGLKENIWEYRIGGYQVCNKWLKDRKGGILSLDDVKHYCKVATAIEHTINIQQSIDEIYSEAEKELMDF